MQKKLLIIPIVLILLTSLIMAGEQQITDDNSNSGDPVYQQMIDSMGFFDRIAFAFKTPFTIIDNNICSSNTDNSGIIVANDNDICYTNNNHGAVAFQLWHWESTKYKFMGEQPVSRGYKRCFTVVKGDTYRWDVYYCDTAVNKCEESPYSAVGCGSSYGCPSGMKMTRTLKGDCGNAPTTVCVDWKDSSKPGCSETVVTPNPNPTPTPGPTPTPSPSPTPTVTDGPNIIATNTPTPTVANGKASITFTLKNTGASMTKPYVLEVQIRPKGLLPLSIVGTQETCDATHPENVHKTFSLASNEEATVTLDNIPVGTGDFDVYAITVDKCWAESPQGNVDVGPYHRGTKVGTITVAESGLFAWLPAGVTQASIGVIILISLSVLFILGGAAWYFMSR